MIDRLTENKIVLITRRTRLAELIVRFNTLDQARFYVEHLGADFADYQAEDQCYQVAVQDTQHRLEWLGRVQALERAYVPNFLFGARDTVGVNDLFIGPRSHTSARYRLGIGDRAEDQSSSGIIVSTGLGATGWLRSIICGAGGIAGALSGHPLKLAAPRSFQWDADYLYFSVREPWPSRTSAAEIAFGKITAATPLILESRMPEGGVIFSDGIESDFVRFNAGACATIGVAARQGRLVT